MFTRLLVVIAVVLAGFATGPQAVAAPGDVSDPNTVYVGRWTNTATTAVPNWTGAYFSTRFTGTTVRVKARDAVNFYASIDGGPDVFYTGVRGTVNLTPTPLASGTRSLRVSYRSGDTDFLRAVRAKYPNAVIFAMETFKKRYVTETQAAVRAVNDPNIRYVNTEGRLTVGADYEDTDGHPNEQGHAKVADRLAPVIGPAIGL